MSEPSSTRPARSEASVGVVQALVAYGLWGLMPLLFAAMAPAGAFEIVSWRIVFGLVFCAVAILATRSWLRTRALLVQPRVMGIMGIAAGLILVNWTVYVAATTTGHTVEAALGYFINPLVTIALGIVVLRERLRPLQWIAVGISVVAVVVIAVGYGRMPWISLALAFSFGLYGLVKKRVGGTVDALSGLTIETVWLLPIAVGALVVLGVTGLAGGVDVRECGRRARPDHGADGAGDRGAAAAVRVLGPSGQPVDPRVDAVPRPRDAAARRGARAARGDVALAVGRLRRGLVRAGAAHGRLVHRCAAECPTRPRAGAGLN